MSHTYLFYKHTFSGISIVNKNLEFWKDVPGTKAIDALAGPQPCPSGPQVPFDLSAHGIPPPPPPNDDLDPSTSPVGPSSGPSGSPAPSATEETQNPTEMPPEVSQKDAPEKEPDVVSDSETDSSKNPNMQTRNCSVVLQGTSSESMNDIRRSQRLNKRGGSRSAEEKVERYNTRNVHNKAFLRIFIFLVKMKEEKIIIWSRAISYRL